MERVIRSQQTGKVRSMCSHVALAFLAMWLSLSRDARADEMALSSRTSLETLVRYLLLWGPEIKLEFETPRQSLIAGFKEIRVRATYQESVQVETLFVSDDGKRLIQGSVFEVSQDPFRSITARISVQDQPRRGPPNASVNLVVFSDFQCPMCRRLADDIRTNVEKMYSGQVSVYFKDLPIPAKHPWALTAAVAGRCLFHESQDVFWAYHDWIFAHQAEITETRLREQILGAIPLGVVEREKLMACIDSRRTEPEVRASMNEASELGVSGTPTVFLNGRKMAGPSWLHLRSALDFELKRKTANPDDCHCTAELQGKDR